MSMNFNTIMITGRLGKDPEVRQFGDTTRAKTSVFTHEIRENSQGAKMEYTEWHRVIVWSKQAEAVAEHLHQWDDVCISGELQTLTYDDERGNHHYMPEIIAWDVIFGERLDDMRNNAKQQAAEMQDNEIPF